MNEAKGQNNDEVGNTFIVGGLSVISADKLKRGQYTALYGLSLLIVFLCLAALYESWSVPIAVLLVVPLGVLGAVLAATLTGLNNDIYLQVGRRSASRQRTQFRSWSSQRKACRTA